LAVPRSIDRSFEKRPRKPLNMSCFEPESGAAKNATV
jgi:hypothetical protein